MMNKDSIKRYYDTNVDQYSHSPLFPYAIRNQLLRIQKVRELLEIYEGETVLEVGTGPAIEAEMLLKEIDVNFIGVDLSQEMLYKANDRLKKLCSERKTRCIKVVQGDGEALPFPDSSFDGGICFGALHHTPNPERMIEELSRVVRPGRNVVILEPNRLDFMTLIQAVTKKIERGALRMSKQNLKDWAEEAKLSDIKIINYLYTPPAPQWLCDFYGAIDKFMSRVPFLNRFSINLILVGTKKSSGGISAIKRRNEK